MLGHLCAVHVERLIWDIVIESVTSPLRNVKGGEWTMSYIFLNLNYDVYSLLMKNNDNFAQKWTLGFARPAWFDVLRFVFFWIN